MDERENRRNGDKRAEETKRHKTLLHLIEVFKRNMPLAVRALKKLANEGDDKR